MKNRICLELGRRELVRILVEQGVDEWLIEQTLEAIPNGAEQNKTG